MASESTSATTRDDVALVLFARRREHAAKSLGLGRHDARLSRLLLHHALECARAAAEQMTVAVVTDEPLPSEALAAGASKHPILHLLQHGDDFESRLLGALRAVAARGFRRLVLVGSDTPSLEPADLARAAAGAPGEAVIGPSSDGGFYLLGVDSAHLEALGGLPWQRAELTRALRHRLESRGLLVDALPTRDDLDSARDTQRAFELLDALHRSYFAQALVEAAPPLADIVTVGASAGCRRGARARAPPR